MSYRKLVGYISNRRQLLLYWIIIRDTLQLTFTIPTATASTNMLLRDWYSYLTANVILHMKADESQRHT